MLDTFSRCRSHVVRDMTASYLVAVNTQKEGGVCGSLDFRLLISRFHAAINHVMILVGGALLSRKKKTMYRCDVFPTCTLWMILEVLAFVVLDKQLNLRAKCISYLPHRRIRAGQFTNPTRFEIKTRI